MAGLTRHLPCGRLALSFRGRSPAPSSRPATRACQSTRQVCNEHDSVTRPACRCKRFSFRAVPGASPALRLCFYDHMHGPDRVGDVSQPPGSGGEAPGESDLILSPGPFRGNAAWRDGRHRRFPAPRATRPGWRTCRIAAALNQASPFRTAPPLFGPASIPRGAPCMAAPPFQPPDRSGANAIVRHTGFSEGQGGCRGGLTSCPVPPTARATAAGGARFGPSPRLP